MSFNKEMIIEAIELIDPRYEHVLEFGVYKGRSIKIIRENLPNSFRVFGFDSFEGLPEDWKDSKNNLVGKCKKGFFSTNGKIPDIRGVKFFKGWFKDTISEYKKIAQKIAFIHIDSDLYSSAKEILWGLNDYIVKGTILLFDEWYYDHDPKYNDHEEKAFFEWSEKFKRRYEMFAEYDGKQIVRI